MSGFWMDGVYYPLPADGDEPPPWWAVFLMIALACGVFSWLAWGTK